jgi:hypothetical protein
VIEGQPETTVALIYGEEEHYTLRGVCFPDEYEHSEENAFETAEAAQYYAKQALNAWVLNLLPPGIRLIAEERIRHTEVLGWTPEHDDEHRAAELSGAAACYAIAGNEAAVGNAVHWANPSLWPWGDEWWNPSPEPVRNLVKAGALVAAEIERLGRIAAQS